MQQNILVLVRAELYAQTVVKEHEKLNVLRSHGLPLDKRTGFGYDINKGAFNYRPNEIGLLHIRIY